MHAKLLSGGQDGATHNRLGAADMAGTGGSGGPDCGARGRRQGLVGQRVDVPPHKAPQAPPIWRAPEGPEGLTAVPVAGGRAWPDNESTRRAKLAARTAGGPPPTGTPSSPAPHEHTKQPGPQERTRDAGTPAAPPTPPEHQPRNTPPRHNKAARPRRGRAAHPVSEDHRRITTMSGSPRPLSWRTFEMPSFEAMSLAVPSIRESS